MRNPVRYQLYIITEGICLNYNGIPILFTKKQVDAFIASLSLITITTSTFYLPKQFKVTKTVSHEHYWWEKFYDSTQIYYNATYIRNNTQRIALEKLDIPLRTYTLEEFYIEPTRKSYKYLINKYTHPYVCSYCRNNVQSLYCYCYRGTIHTKINQNDYHDFRSVIISNLCR